MEQKKITIELTEQDSAIIQIALELREMHFPPHSLSDRKRLPELKRKLYKKHTEVFDYRVRRKKTD